MAVKPSIAWLCGQQNHRSHSFVVGTHIYVLVVHYISLRNAIHRAVSFKLYRVNALLSCSALGRRNVAPGKKKKHRRAQIPTPLTLNGKC